MQKPTTRAENNLPSQLHALIHSDELKQAHRRSDEDFTRNRALTFSRTVLTLLALPQKSYSAELRTVFETLDGTDEKAPTRSALTRARSKVKHSVFIVLNKSLLGMSAEQISNHRITFKKYTLVGIDGSTLQLPEDEELRKKFDPNRPANDIPQARISECFDIGTDLRLDAIIAPTSTSERDMLVRHLKSLPENVLLVMDRGYAAHWVFQLLVDMNIKFCIRTSTGFNKSIRSFLDSGEKEAATTIYPTDVSEEQLGAQSLAPRPVEVRAVRVELDTGETEILITNLDADDVPHGEMKELYWMRWGSETAYKREKLNYAVENFSGLTAESVYQDYYANIFMMNLTAIIALPAHSIIEEETKTCTRRYSLNWMNAARLMREKGVALLGLADKAAAVFRQIFRNLGDDLTIVRPGRSFERKVKSPGRKFCMNHKML